jgi:hypothetical protein
MRRAPIILALMLGLILMNGSDSFRAFAQIPDQIEFDETGHILKGVFLEKYLSIPQYADVIGEAITDEFTADESSPVAGMKVQYFRKARFEFHNDNPPGEQVVLAPLGRLLFEINPVGPLEAQPINDPGCTYFNETKHQVCYAFRAFYESHGGLEIFGFPISEIIVVNDRRVQYFDYARFEWHPELPAGKQVVLSNVGELYFKLSEKQSLALPGNRNRNNIPITKGKISDLKVHAFPVNALTPSGSTQTIYVLVQDQSRQMMVPNVQVTLDVSYPSGVIDSFGMPITDENGITRITFPVQKTSLGVVDIVVTAVYVNITKITRCSFRIWW